MGVGGARRSPTAFIGGAILDRVFEQWNDTDSDPSQAGVDHTNVDNLEEPVLSDNDASTRPYHTADFNGDNDDDNVLGGEDVFLVEVTFHRDMDGLFSSVCAHIEPTAPPVTYSAGVITTLRKGHAVDLVYQISVEADDNGSESTLPINAQVNSNLRNEWLNMLSQNSRPAPLGSNRNLSRFESWAERVCRNSQTAIDQSTSVPTRLIDVGHHDLRLIRVADIHVQSGPSRGYIALSYVWGVTQNFVLRCDTEAMLMQSFSLKDLPQTLHDAVTVARRTGFRYLWVDALCIIQDSDADKGREVPKMGEIYRRAALTLAAAIAHSAVEGFLHIQEQKSYAIDPFEIPCSPNEESGVSPTVTLCYPADYRRWKDPMNERGWTFQEYLLSSRLAIFSYRGLETVDWSNGLIPRSPHLSEILDVEDVVWRRATFTLSPAQADAQTIREIWLTVRGEYSQRRLGHQSDKLIAISAIAQEIGRSYSSTYLAGLWERDLAEDLKWCHVQFEFTEDWQSRPLWRSLRAEYYVARSWSWASIQGPIDDHSFENCVDVKDWLHFGIVSCEVTATIPDFEYGAVRGGSLVVRDRSHVCLWRPQNPPKVDCDGVLVIRTKEEPYGELVVGEVIVDAADEALNTDCVVECVALSLSERIPKQQEIQCLVLLPAGEGSYRRVGFGVLSFMALFDEADWHEITIV